ITTTEKRRRRPGRTQPYSRPVLAAARGYGDDTLETRLFPNASQAQKEKPLPDWAQVDREPKAGKHVTLQLSGTSTGRPTQTALPTASSPIATGSGRSTTTPLCARKTSLASASAR